MPNLPRTINRLKDPRDLWLFLQIFALLVRLPGLIKRMNLPELLKHLDPGIHPVPRDNDKLLKTVGFADTLLRYRYFQKYGKCLMRSLLLFRFLRQQGWPVDIHFGVRKEAAAADPGGISPDHMSITGHSWLVLDGEAFLEGEDTARFSTTFIYGDDADSGSHGQGEAGR